MDITTVAMFGTYLVLLLALLRLLYHADLGMMEMLRHIILLLDNVDDKVDNLAMSAAMCVDKMHSEIKRRNSDE